VTAGVPSVDALLRRIEQLERTLARREAELRRARRGVLTVGDLRVHQLARRVRRGRETLDLNAMEYQLLALLARNVGQVVSAREVDRWLFGSAGRPKSNSVQVHLFRVRRALAGSRVAIETVRGEGYRLMVSGAALPQRL
jgi:DNA-binding response OmpR family regulator